MSCPKNRLQQQTGFSLIELMIALTIGLLLIAGLGTILFSVRSSYLTQDGLTRMQEGQRFFLTSLNNSVQTAGYFIDPVNDSALNALPASGNNPDGSSFAAGQSITGTAGATPTTSDTVNTRYQSASDDDAMNCLGGTNTSGAPVVWINSFFVDASHQLNCTAKTIGTATPPTSRTEVLVSNVAKMKVLYGVGVNGDGQTSRYLDATQVTAWQDVVSVKVTITQEDLVNGNPASPNLAPLVHVINLMNSGSRRVKGP